MEQVRLSEAAIKQAGAWKKQYEIQGGGMMRVEWSACAKFQP